MNTVFATGNSKREMWAGRILTGMVTLILLGSGIAKATGVPRMVEGLTRAGIPRQAIVPIAALELLCLGLYLIPRTTLLGTLLLTGYFGGATVTHLIGGESLAPPLLVGLAIWGGAWFRVPELRPRREPRAAAASREVARFAPWINRIVLWQATLLFTRIGWRYLADPVRASAAAGATLTSAAAATTTRIGFGAFPLALAIFCFACLLSRRRLVAGVSLVATVVTTAIVVRLFSLVTGGAVAASTKLFIPEIAILLLSACGLFLEAARAKRQSGATA